MLRDRYPQGEAFRVLLYLAVFCLFVNLPLSKLNPDHKLQDSVRSLGRTRDRYPWSLRTWVPGADGDTISLHACCEDGMIGVDHKHVPSTGAGVFVSESRSQVALLL